jgi:rubredoxin
VSDSIVLLRCPYCTTGADFKLLVAYKKDGRFVCEQCTHTVRPAEPDYRCTCRHCLKWFKSQENSSRKLVWIEGQRFVGWGCSECDWVFNLPDLPTGKSLDEVKRSFEMQLSDEFAFHACAKRAKGATLSS